MTPVTYLFSAICKGPITPPVWGPPCKGPKQYCFHCENRAMRPWANSGSIIKLMNFPPLTRLIGGKRGVLGILKLMFMNLGNYKKPECLVFQIPAQVKEILGRLFLGVQMPPPHAEGVWKPSGTKNITVQLLQQNPKNNQNQLTTPEG